MPRFVILEHDYPERHWDFMLEAGEKLRTWKLSSPPQIGKTVSAQLSFDHRIVYLDYEGPISGNRGTVVRFDKGSFTWQQESDDHVRVDLLGTVLICVADLRREADGKWRLIVTG
ncbi:MAG: hypothetical protein C5B53_06240 [Candidatus Melainabacteria bacterium]|nr:MAG: hypothetical protein C5B53_06240 [Candidatus Melainabacteria bacterium]